MNFEKYVKEFYSQEGDDGKFLRAAAYAVKIDLEKDIVDAISFKDDDGDLKFRVPKSGRLVVDVDNEQMFLTWIPVPDLTCFLEKHKDENQDDINCPYDIVCVFLRDYEGTNIPFFTTLEKLGSLFFGAQDVIDVHVLANPLKSTVNYEIENMPKDLTVTQSEIFNHIINALVENIRIDKEDGTIEYDGKAVVNFTTQFSHEEKRIIKFECDYSDEVFNAPADVIILVNHSSDTMGNVQFFASSGGVLMASTMLKGKVDGYVNKEDSDADLTEYFKKIKKTKEQ